MTQDTLTQDTLTKVRKPSIGVGVVVFRSASPDSDVLLIRRGTPPRQGEWSIPGGKQEWGETVRETAQRECREETGLSIDILGLIDVVDLLYPDAKPDNGTEDIPDKSRPADGTLSHHYTLIDFVALATDGILQAGSDASEARWVPHTEIATYQLWAETERIIDLARSQISAASQDNSSDLR